MDRYQAASDMHERILIEDALKAVHESDYQGRIPTPEGLAGVLGIDLDQAVEVFEQLQASDLLVFEDGGHRLSEKGIAYARHVIRAHRLYETLLARETGYAAEAWHQKAESREHELTERDVAELAQRLGNPRYDPDGDPIPTATGELPPPMGRPLMACDTGADVRVIHVEDEPPRVYQRLASLAMAPGMPLRVLYRGSDHIRVLSEGRELRLSLSEAAAVEVEALPGDATVDASVGRLSALSPGKTAEVVGLAPACRGPDRNRLLDLGFVPGTRLEMDLVNPSGSPVAYRVRGALVALRREQAERVLIRPL